MGGCCGSSTSYEHTITCAHIHANVDPGEHFHINRDTYDHFNTHRHFNSNDHIHADSHRSAEDAIGGDLCSPRRRIIRPGAEYL